jgi:hypothetical protein
VIPNTVKDVLMPRRIGAQLRPLLPQPTNSSPVPRSSTTSSVSASDRPFPPLIFSLGSRRLSRGVSMCISINTVGALQCHQQLYGWVTQSYWVCRSRRKTAAITRIPTIRIRSTDVTKGLCDLTAGECWPAAKYL